MKPPLFKIGIGLMVVGIFWLSLIFFEGERISDKFWLKSSESVQMEMNFEGNDIGYYKIYMPEFRESGVFIQILDQNYNVVFDGVIETKMSVGYFDYEKSSEYSIKIINLSEKQIFLVVEFGETNGRQMMIPGLVTLIGGIILVIATYIKLRDYSIAQPDENIS